MDVLVVGGTGLISTGITRQLVAAGHDVTLYNRGRTDADVPDVETVTGDRTEYATFEAQVADLDVDCVIDMVCYDPEDAESAVRAFADRVEQYVFCSTVDVYHRPVDSMPVAEDAPREPPVSEYGRKKAVCEDVFFAAHDRSDFAATVLRPWHTYGEGGTLNYSLGSDPHYVERIRSGEPIVVHGDGTSVWGPCHRDDVARAFVNAVGNEDAYGEAYNVTSEECMTWATYHRKVASALDAPEPDLVRIPTDVLLEVAPDRTAGLRKHFQFSTVFDNEKARRDLEFRYEVDFEEGVARTVAHLDDHGADYDPPDAEPTDDELVAAWRSAREAFLATRTSP